MKLKLPDAGHFKHLTIHITGIFPLILILDYKHGNFPLIEKNNFSFPLVPILGGYKVENSTQIFPISNIPYNATKSKIFKFFYRYKK